MLLKIIYTTQMFKVTRIESKLAVNNKSSVEMDL